VDEQRSEHDVIGVHSGFHGGLIFAAPYMALYMLYPMVWAILTGVVLMMVLGMFTAKFIFGVRSLWTALGLSPLLGACWIGFFYVLMGLVQR
jgi:hypothetical protein